VTPITIPRLAHAAIDNILPFRLGSSATVRDRSISRRRSETMPGFRMGCEQFKFVRRNAQAVGQRSEPSEPAARQTFLQGEVNRAASSPPDSTCPARSSAIAPKLV
jgi:hypothetical protein